MAVATRYDVSLINSEAGVLILPKYWRGDGTKTGVIFTHGANGTELEALNPNGDPLYMMNLVQYVVETGRPALSCFFGGNQWGNASAIAKVTTAANFLQGQGTSDKIGFIAQSMGHLTAMNWVAQNRARTRFVISSMGVCDLNNIYANPSYTVSINAAYGGAWSNATYGATYNPIINTTAKYGGLPWLGFGGTEDAVCPISITSTLAASVGSTATFVPVSGAHAWNTVGNYDLGTIKTFLDRYDA